MDKGKNKNKDYGTGIDDVYNNEENVADVEQSRQTAFDEEVEDEDAETDTEGEYADADYEQQEEEGPQEVNELVDKAKEYFKKNFANVDSENLLKYASMAVLAVYGIRKSGILSSILISIAVGVLAKYLLSGQSDLKAETE